MGGFAAISKGTEVISGITLDGLVKKAQATPGRMTRPIFEPWTVARYVRDPRQDRETPAEDQGPPN